VRPAKLLSPFSEALSFRLQFRKILALYGHCYSKRDEAAPSTVGPASFNYLITMEKNGADDPTRTDDLLITSELLYQLSYVGPGGELRLSLRQPSLAKSAIAHRRAARVPDACAESGPRFSRGSSTRPPSDGADDLWGRRARNVARGLHGAIELYADRQITGEFAAGPSKGLTGRGFAD
jgi:hypothetical protein